jgi:hypothetical protein
VCAQQQTAARHETIAQDTLQLWDTKSCYQNAMWIAKKKFDDVVLTDKVGAAGAT